MYFGSSFDKKDWTSFIKHRNRTGPASFLELRNTVCNFVAKETSSIDDKELENVMEELKKPVDVPKFSETETERDIRRQRFKTPQNLNLD